jgi:hypothetical protein
MTRPLLRNGLLVLVTALLACDAVGGEAGRGATGERAAAPATAPAGEGDDHEHEGGGECGGSCGEGPTAADERPLAAATAVGGEVTDTVELVDAGAIVADPEAYAGRTVRVAGVVKGFCHHRRAWFAVDVPGGDPPYLQIATAPGFQVPPGIMNARATAVGVVEISEVPGSRRSHYEREHALGAGSAQPGRAVRAVIRATGARFEPPAS